MSKKGPTKQRKNEPDQARTRALRAAQVVTIGLALAGGACSASVLDPGNITKSQDSRPQKIDGSSDAILLTDAEQDSTDATPDTVLDGRTDTNDELCDKYDPNPEAFPLDPCCMETETHNDGTTSKRVSGVPTWGYPEEGEWGCLAWGPYVPPAFDCLPTSRSKGMGHV